MKIKKIFNNNVVLIKNNQNEEQIGMGCGIAFKKKVGEYIDIKKLEKVFVLKEKDLTKKFEILLEHISSDIINLCFDIIEYGKNILDENLNEYIYISLTDHIDNVIKLFDQGIKTNNILIWEIKKFYKKEYKIGLKALEFIKEELGKELQEEEAANIALHFINAQNNYENIKNTNEMTKKIKNIVNIIKYTYSMELDENSLNYERFITHLRYFFRRIKKKDEKETLLEDDFIFNQVKNKYKEAYNCMLKIEKYLDIELKNDEKLYLTLHIKRVTND